MLFFVGVAFGQELPCAALLGALPNTRFNDLTSFEAAFTYQEDDDITTIRQVEDVKNERSYYEVTEDSGEMSIVRYEGDTGTVARDGQTEVAPPKEEIDLLPFLEVFLSQKIFSEAELLSCDGEQTLETPEGTIQGDAVSVTIQDDNGQLFFDTNGHIIGWKSESDTGVFENEYQDNLLVKSAFRIYVKPEETASIETATLERVMTFELITYDQPIDETLFGESLECEGLLETFTAQPELSSTETTTTYTNNPEVGSDYKVVDFTNERVYWELDVAGEKTIFRLVNGEVTGAKENGEEIEVSEGIRVSLENTFSASASFRELADKAVVLSCDGEHSYSDASGEIVRGQQLTVADKTNPGSDSAKLLFDAEGNFIGNYVDRPDNGFLIVNSGIQKDETGVITEITNATYRQEGKVFELLSKTTTRTLSYNQPIDETLFTK